MNELPYSTVATGSYHGPSGYVTMPSYDTIDLDQAYYYPDFDPNME